MKKICLLFFITTCSVLPPNYKESLIGTWNTSFQVSTPTGVGDVNAQQVFNLDGTYTLTTIDVAGVTTILNYTYQVGNIDNFPAYVLLNKDLEQAENAVYFSFSSNNQILTTSTNRSQVLPRIWQK